MALRLRRGTDSQRQLITPAEGELIYTTDTKRLWIGDGTTLGGTLVNTGGAYSLDSLVDVDTTTVEPEVGDVLKFNGVEFVPSAESAPTTPGSSYYINIEDDLGDPLLNAEERFFAGSIKTTDLVSTIVDADNAEVYASFFGDIKGDLYSTFTDELVIDTSFPTARITGDLTGDVEGDLTGDVLGDLTGNVLGNVTGNIISFNTLSTVVNTIGPTATFTGDLTGNVTGNVIGNVVGDVVGSIFSDDSTLIVDAVNGRITTNEIRAFGTTLQITAPSTYIRSTTNELGRIIGTHDFNPPSFALELFRGSISNPGPLLPGDFGVNFNWSSYAEVGGVDVMKSLASIIPQVDAGADIDDDAPLSNLYLLTNAGDGNGEDASTNYRIFAFKNDGSFQSKIIQPFALPTVAITAITPAEGMIVFDSTLQKFRGYVSDTGLAGGGPSNSTPGWVDLN